VYFYAPTDRVPSSQYVYVRWDEQCRKTTGCLLPLLLQECRITARHKQPTAKSYTERERSSVARFFGMMVWITFRFTSHHMRCSFFKCVVLVHICKTLGFQGKGLYTSPLLWECIRRRRSAFCKVWFVGKWSELL